MAAINFKYDPEEIVSFAGCGHEAPAHLRPRDHEHARRRKTAGPQRGQAPGRPRRHAHSMAYGTNVRTGPPPASYSLAHEAVHGRRRSFVLELAGRRRQTTARTGRMSEL